MTLEISVTRVYGDMSHSSPTRLPCTVELCLKIRILTNRPIPMGEAWVNQRSLDYNLSALKLDISKQNKSSGILMAAVQFKIDKKAGEVVAENYQIPGNFRNIMDRSTESRFRLAGPGGTEAG